MKSFFLVPVRIIPIVPFVLASVSITVLTGAAIAQTLPVVEVDPDGSVFVDSDAFNIFSGPNENSSNIPMPRNLIRLYRK